MGVEVRDCAEFGDGGRGVSQAAGGEVDDVALVGELAGDLAANATVGTGHDGNAIHRCSLPMSD
jgi:hypothetical protein